MFKKCGQFVLGKNMTKLSEILVRRPQRENKKNQEKEYGETLSGMKLGCCSNQTETPFNTKISQPRNML